MARKQNVANKLKNKHDWGITVTVFQRKVHSPFEQRQVSAFNLSTQALRSLIVGEDKMKPAVIVSLLVMFAILTFGKPANEEKHEAGAKTVTFYHKDLQSDSPIQKRGCTYRVFCGYLLRCCTSRKRSADENKSETKTFYNANDDADENEQVAGAKEVTTFYKNNLQSDAPKDQAKRGCIYTVFCGYLLRCC
ncbi:hypothetical protein ACROYT_G035318 [Oculina patagonica]